MDQRDIKTGRDYFEFKDPSGNITIVQAAEERRSPALCTLLDMMRLEVKERLEQSIHRINLDKVSQPSQVESPWEMTLQRPQQPPKALPPGTRIFDVFEQADVNKRLLLLGLPGSGKTTTMLELADRLLQRCEKTPLAPVPVLLNLASWKNTKESIFDWLVREIKSKYSLRQDLGAQWLQEKKLLPLLDGLDEVDPRLQKDCAIAINRWLSRDPERQPIGTLVCCRSEEYQMLVQHHLFLGAAIELQPLTNKQIEAYLIQFTLQEVWQSLQHCPELIKSLRTPLFLSTFSFITATKKIKPATWQQMSTDQIQTYLFEQYLDVAMKISLVTKKENDVGVRSKTYEKAAPPQKEALFRYMHFLSKLLENQGSSEFILERVDINSLPDKISGASQYKVLYRAAFTALFSSLLGSFGLICSLYPAYLTFSQPNASLRLIVLFIAAFTFLFILFGILLSFLAFPVKVKLFEKLEFSQTIFHANIQKSIRYIIFIGAVLLLTLPLIYNTLSGGIIIAIFATITLWIIPSFTSVFESTFEAPRAPDQGLRNTTRFLFFSSILSIVLVSVLVITLRQPLLLICSLEEANFVLVISASIFLMTVFAFSGLIALLKYFSFRLVLTWYKLAPFRYIRLLNYAAERRILQRVGGRYRFIHRLLQDHFAAMKLD